MKNVFVSLIQQCICLDFLINALIHSKSYQYINLLSTIREENLRNIKLICHLYECTFNSYLILEDATCIKINKNHEDNINILLKLNFKILSDLEKLKKYNFYNSFSNLLQALICNYFNIISSLQCFRSINSNKNLDDNQFIDINQTYLNNNKSNIRFFYLNSNELLDEPYEYVSLNDMREICINAINVFFNYSLIDNKVIDEYYEVFFENNFDNKFYQYFFKTDYKIFKVRIDYKTRKLLYIYQSINNNDLKIFPPLNKDNSKKLVDEYLKEKFDIQFENLVYDKDYLNTSVYDNLIESYKFRYNYKDNFGKINLNNDFYITINTFYLIIEEISLF